MFKRILIANRGEIAVRIIRACKELGIETVAVYSTADQSALHVQLATLAICIGNAPSKDSYLNKQNILSAALLHGCDAIHPGFGFLSEDASFARLIKTCGMQFIGPSASIIDQMGDKAEARRLMKEAGVPIIEGSVGIIETVEEGLRQAEQIGFPVMIKASAGGGGKGMRIAHNAGLFKQAFEVAQQEAMVSFNDGRVYIEKYLEAPKHIEVQIIGDHYGHYIHLYERDCSMQRRNQKMIEESPCVSLPAQTREAMLDASIQAAKRVGYNSVGTIEYLVDADFNYYFIEMNTRVQVEHPVTEMVTGVDVIKEQIRVASGLPLSYKQEDISINGHAIECRINAEDVMQQFRPTAGYISACHFPGGPGIRIDSAIYSGYTLPPFYDSMVAKLIVHGKTRLECIKKMRWALEEFIIEGIQHNVSFHYVLMHHPKYVEGYFNTSYIETVVEEVLLSGKIL